MCYAVINFHDIMCLVNVVLSISLGIQIKSLIVSQLCIKFVNDVLVFYQISELLSSDCWTDLMLARCPFCGVATIAAIITTIISLC